MKCHLIHGIHTGISDPSVPSLIPYLHGEVVYPDYGFILAGETRRINPAVIGSLQNYVGPDDVMIGHSNGCAIIYGLLQRGVKMKGVVFINAALTTWPGIPDYVKFCHCYYNSGDDITEIAQVAEELGLVDPNWGAMGHFGYKGTDQRWRNFCGDLASAPGTLPGLCGHSDLFTPTNIEKWGPFVSAVIDQDYAR